MKKASNINMLNKTQPLKNMVNKVQLTKGTNVLRPPNKTLLLQRLIKSPTK